MAVALWSFLLKRDGSFIKYPQTRYERFVQGAETLGHSVGVMARFVDVAVIVNNRRPVQAVRFWYPQYRLTGAGAASHEHLHQRLVDSIHAVSVAVRDPRDDVVSISPYLARKQHDIEHAWRPSGPELDAAVTAINDRGRRELVVTDGKTLRWVDYGYSP
jgi:hypothetical protein